MSVHVKLMQVQSKLKAPKGQTNSFGNYKYRSCEDILEAVKPLLAEVKAVLTLSDEVVEIGGRYYIKATATFTDAETDNSSISNTAFAREAEDKKGMDVSQVSGTASSYARKYCLNGLFCIDDTKDADTDEYGKQTTVKKGAGRPVETSSAPKMSNVSSKGNSEPYTKNEGGSLMVKSLKDGQWLMVEEMTLKQMQWAYNCEKYAGAKNQIAGIGKAKFGDEWQ